MEPPDVPLSANFTNLDKFNALQNTRFKAALINTSDEQPPIMSKSCVVRV